MIITIDSFEQKKVNGTCYRYERVKRDVKERKQGITENEAETVNKLLSYFGKGGTKDEKD